jgi:molecular chaperone DnaK (HSP70)
METILTVPAVWSEKAKSDTIQCAHRAGFGELDKIRIITEPEAAAVYTFHQVRRRSNHHVAIALILRSYPISPSKREMFS